MTTLTTAPRRLATALAYAAALTALAARPADAQFKKLKDLGKAAAKGAVEGAAEGATKKAVGGPEGSPATPGTVKFTENLLEITAVRAAGGVREAFQSYPALLLGDGEVPAPLRARGRGVDLEHRDARLALGELRDGRVLIALTRFEGLGGALDALPFGPTVPEMAAVMGALGARRALLLDGGISGQLLVRDAGQARAWTGLRKVPLGLVVVPR